MKLFQKLLLAPAALGLMAPVAASAADLNVAGIRQYTTSEEQVTSITQFSDVKPTDWAYQALSNLIERYGCVAGYPNSTYKGGQAMTRYEAAALLNACLDRVTEVTDEVKRLVKEFEKELAVLKGRVDSLEAKVGELEATQFSTTTKLKGIATFVLGGNSFTGNGGIPRGQDLNRAEAFNSSLGATTFNYDLRLNLDTSFTGKDLLRTTLRAGNFAASAYGTGLTFLEPAFESVVDGGSTAPNVVSINRLFYNFPVGDELSVTAGGVVRVDDPGMLGIWPSVYPADTVLDFFTYAGAPGAYNLAVLGGGAGFVYSPKWAKGLTISQNYVAVGSNNADPDAGGIMTTGTPAGAVTQIAYVGDKTPLIGGSYALAAAYTYLQGGQTGDAPCASGTPDACTFGNNVVSTNSIALSGYWKPEKSGFIPSISWGIGNTSSGDSQNGGNDVIASWYTGLQWDDAFIKGNAAGMAVGQAPYVSKDWGAQYQNDSNWMWEWWYKFQVTDNISVTPAVYYISRYAGESSAEFGNGSGTNVNVFGGLLKTTFKF